MNLNEAKQLLNDNGYALDEGIGNLAKKARRAIFGKNKNDEDILAKRKARLQDNEETRRESAKKAEHFIEHWDNESYDVLRTIKRRVDDDENYGEASEVRAVYNALVALKKKWDKNITFAFDSSLGFGDATWVVHVIGVNIKEVKDKAWGTVTYGKDDNGQNKIVRRSAVNRNVGDLTYKLGSIGLFAGSNSVSRDNTNNKYKLKYATGLETRKMTETDNMEEWASKVNGLMREYIQGVKADDVDDWEANIDQNESVKVKQAVNILKENGYIVEGHWYDSTTGFRRYREEPDEREARYYNTLEGKFKELKEADEAQDKDRIRFHLETIEIFVRRIGHAISSSDKKGLAKDGLAKIKKYFQDKGQDDLAALVDKYAEEVIRLVW